jgi:enoyl-CoA hydratase/carnithine racemase
VLEVRIEGPGKNALGTPVMEALQARLDEAGGRPLLLTGAGDAFSAGLNLKEILALDAPGMEAFLRRLERLVATLHAHPGPTVACVNGHAIAGGCVLALCCDHRLALDLPGTRIGLNEVVLGLRFPPSILRLVRQRVSPAHQAEVLLGAGLHDPRAALRLGLLDEVVAEDAPGAARRRLEALAAHPPDAYAAAKAALRAPLVDSAEDAAFAAILPTWSSPELKARIAAVLKPRG